MQNATNTILSIDKYLKANDKTWEQLLSFLQTYGMANLTEKRLQTYNRDESIRQAYAEYRKQNEYCSINDFVTDVLPYHSEWKRTMIYNALKENSKK